MAGIREECDRVSASSGGAWTRETVSRLFRVDSTIKESMRVSDFGVVALHRRVSCDHRFVGLRSANTRNTGFCAGRDIPK